MPIFAPLLINNIFNPMSAQVFKIFIVEDDPWYGEMLRHYLTLNDDYEVSLFDTGQACLDHLYLKPDVVSIDFNLPDIGGEELLKRIKQTNPGIDVIVISGQEDIAVALSMLKKGAYEYLMKDDNTKDLLWNSILRLRETSNLKLKVEELKNQLVQKFDFEKTVIGQSAAIKKIFPLVEKAAGSSINVSITGETGTGKEVVAKAIHFNSERRKKPFIAVNMAAIPRDLMESELFGFEKGAFTGAINRKTGKFEEANGGTLFLDEIAECDAFIQTKLLRVLQEREIQRLGGNQSIKLDIRLIVATHKDLTEEVKKGNFREDLYYRVMGMPIELAPLRERENDVLILAKHFIEQYSAENKIKALVLSPDARQKLLQYDFPGNIRELKAVIELACVMSDGKTIEANDISLRPTTLSDHFLNVKTEKTLRQYTIDIITWYLNKYDNNVVDVAERLDIGKSTIYNMIQAGEIKR
jgi:two-component system, NtrC family, response regulator AtoC